MPRTSKSDLTLFPFILHLCPNSYLTYNQNCIHLSLASLTDLNPGTFTMVKTETSVIGIHYFIFVHYIEIRFITAVCLYNIMLTLDNGLAAAMP